jgi:hypothetical protein
MVGFEAQWNGKPGQGFCNDSAQFSRSVIQPGALIPLQAGIVGDHKHRKGNDTAGGLRTEELHRVRNPGNPQAVNYQDRREQLLAPKKMARDKQERSWQRNHPPSQDSLEMRIQYFLRLLAAPNAQNRECPGKKRDPYDCQARIDFRSCSWSMRWRATRIRGWGATGRWRWRATFSRRWMATGRWRGRLSARCSAYPQRQYHCRNCVL